MRLKFHCRDIEEFKTIEMFLFSQEYKESNGIEIELAIDELGHNYLYYLTLSPFNTYIYAQDC